MATSETEYYNRLDLIVVRVGTVTARKLFKKRVDDLKPNDVDSNTWNVDTFMDLKRRQIMQLRPKNTIKFHLYPEAPKKRDYTKWDIGTLVFVLTKVCGLDDTLRAALDTLKSIRNTLDHLNDPAVKLATYQKTLADLKQNHALCLRAINDERFEEEQKKLFREFEHEPLSVSDMTKFYHKKTKEQKEVKSILTKNQKDNRTILRKLDKLTERACMNFPPATERRDLDTDDDIVQQFDVELKLLFSECDIEKAKQVFLDAFKRRIAETCDVSPPQLTNLHEAAGRAYEDLLSTDYKIVNAYEGCVGLQIRFKSPRELLNFFRDYFEGKLQGLFEPVTAALQTLPGLENLTLDVVIYEDEFRRVIDNTVTFLSSVLPGAEESNVTEKNSIVIEDDHQSPTVVEDESFEIYRRLQDYKPESIPDPDLPSHEHFDEDEEQTHVKTIVSGKDSPPAN